jgi:mitogen-activated protein kinase kinase kinase
MRADHPRSASQSDKSVGFSVGKGGFARPTTSAGTLSSTPAGLVITSTMEDLLRKTIKFGSEEDGVTKLVNVENITDVVEILTRVLKKFSKLAPSAKLSRLWDGDLTYSELDGWGIYASGGDGIGA